MNGSGNTMNLARDDGGKGEWSPQYGIVLARLNDSIVKDNVLWHGAIKTLVEDRSGHGPNVIIRDNIGSTWSPASQPGK